MKIKERQKLRSFINKLSLVRGRHTELVSVYIPADYDIQKIINHLQQEQGTAVNIKDQRTRKNVQDSLEKIIRHLRLFRKTPNNGLAVFAGNISDQEGKIDIQVFSVEPPEPIAIRLYRCEHSFVIDILKNMLEHKEMYGLIVLDKREATIGLLKGTAINKLTKLTSGVPGKFKAGGQCLSKDTLIMRENGEIVELKEVHNPFLIISENFNTEKTEKTPIIAKWENNKELFNISTCYPKLEIKASKDHMFFIRTENGIEEKSLSEIKEKDYLIFPEKINLFLKDQNINFIPKIKCNVGVKKVILPKKINSKLAKLLGYYLGDGSYEIDRLTFFEQREEVAEYYKRLIEGIFKTKARLTFRKSKNYYQIRVYSRLISQLFNNIFNKKDKTLSEKIPSIILKSSDKSIASFISGFFDAEGYISKNRNTVALGINNRILAKQLQFVLLRIGIISSILEYNNQRNPYSKKIRYTLAIDDIGSLKKFYDLIGFNSLEKQNKLKKAINVRSNKNKVRQIVVNGKDIAKIIRTSGLTTTQFRCPNYFVNKKQLSKEIFKKNILNKIKDIKLKKRLELFYSSNLLVAKISKIKSVGIGKTIDIETKNHNFIANGLIVHNSAARFSRLREGAAKEFFKRISEACNKEFLGKENLKGILLGGPGPSKEEFLEYLNQELKNKIIGIKDLTYTDESGLHDLVDKSQDTLAKEIIMEEKALMNRFFTLLAKEPEKVTYGLEEVRKALDYSAVEIILISEDLDEKLIDEFEQKADATKAEVQLISLETREGIQLKDFGGIAAILRFAIE